MRLSRSIFLLKRTFLFGISGRDKCDKGSFSAFLGRRKGFFDASTHSAFQTGHVGRINGRNLGDRRQRRSGFVIRVPRESECVGKCQQRQGDGVEWFDHACMLVAFCLLLMDKWISWTNKKYKWMNVIDSCREREIDFKLNQWIVGPKPAARIDRSLQVSWLIIVWVWWMDWIDPSLLEIETKSLLKYGQGRCCYTGWTRSFGFGSVFLRQSLKMRQSHFRQTTQS